MTNNIIFSPQLSNLSLSTKKLVSETTEDSLKNLAGFSLLSQLQNQLESISKQILKDHETKQQLQEEIEILRNLEGKLETPENLEKDALFSEYEIRLLDSKSSNTKPTLEKNSNPVSYPSKEKTTDSLETAIRDRENQLIELNSSSEINLLQIQSLTEQRKNLFSLISNLLATSHESAKNIINNFK